MEKYLGTSISEVPTEGLEVRDWKIPGNIAQLQAADVTLKHLFDKGCGGEAKVMTLYVVEDGVLCILRKMGPVTYQIHYSDKGKESKVYHVNLNKE